MLKRIGILVILTIVIILFHLGYGIEGNLTRILVIRVNILIQYMLIGLILSLCGLILQSLLYNPLAEPYILGVSSGASLGAVIAIFFSLQPLLFFRSLFALIGAFAVCLLILMLSRRPNGFSIGIAVLAGVGFNALFSGLIFLLQSLLRPNDLKSAINWVMGYIDFARPADIVLLGIGALVALLFVLIKGRELDIYLSGEEMASAVGLDTSRLKMQGFIAVSLATGIAVSIAGMIGFIGMVVPHIVCIGFGIRHRFSIPYLFVISLSLLTLAGVLSRHLLPGTVLPVGVMTAILGAPFFILILVTRYKGI